MFRTARPPRRALARTTMALVAAAALTVSGCAAGQVSQSANQVAAVDGANGAIGDLTVLNARLAPTEREKYPAGSDARVLLWISNGSINPDTLTGVSTPVAQSVKISGGGAIPGETLKDFATDKGATLTVTSFLQDQYYGVSIPMTFSFANAGTLTLNVPIELPPERSTTRETVDIQPPHETPIWEQGINNEAGSGAGATGSVAPTSGANNGGNVEGAPTSSSSGG